MNEQISIVANNLRRLSALDDTSPAILNRAAEVAINCRGNERFRQLYMIEFEKNFFDRRLSMTATKKEAIRTLHDAGWRPYARGSKVYFMQCSCAGAA